MITCQQVLNHILSNLSPIESDGFYREFHIKDGNRKVIIKAQVSTNPEDKDGTFEYKVSSIATEF